MKSLKRTLSLVLALVMVLGLFGGISMTAAATDFSDDKDVQYNEAVDVMTGIGAINGMGDGTFKPQNKITRAEAATMLTRAIIGKDAAKRLSGVTSSFTDVPASKYDWAIPSIEYLREEGIISGVGGNTFNPEGEVTGYEIGKMLLCSLGYGAKGEYTGKGWDFRVALDGSKNLPLVLANAAGGAVAASAGEKASVFGGRAKDANDLSAAASREEVALYCFNTLQISQVEYISTLDLYATVNSNLGNELGSIIDNVYPGLVRDTTAAVTDAYGRPARKWTYNDNDICKITETPILTITKDMSETAFNVAISNAGYKVGAGSPGDPDAPPTYVKNAVSGLATDIVSAKVAGGKGVLIEVYGNSTSKYVTEMVRIDTWLGMAKKVTEDKAETTNVDERTIALYAANGTTKLCDVPSDVEGFDAVYSVVKTLLDSGKDKVPVMYNGKDTITSGKDIIALSVPETAELKISSAKESSSSVVASFVADGKTYEVAAKGSVATGNISLGKANTVIMDKYGYVYAVSAVEESLNVAMVIDTGETVTGFTETPQLKALTLEGKEVVLPISAVYGPDGSAATTQPTDDTDVQPLKNCIISYTPDSKHEGLFNITVVNNGFQDVDSTAVSNITKAGVITGTAIDIYTGNTAINANFTSNDGTVFVVGVYTEYGSSAKPSYEIYTGVKNVPSLHTTPASTDLNKGNADYTVYDKNSDGIAEVVFISKAAFKDTGTEDLSFFVIGDKVIKLAGHDGTDYKELTIISNDGTITQGYILDSVVSTLSANRIIKNYTIDNEKIVTAATDFNPAGGDPVQEGDGKGIEAVSKGVVILDTEGATPFKQTCKDDCAVWVVDSTAAEPIKKVAVKDIETDTNDLVYWLEAKDTKVVSTIYIVKVAGNPTRYAVTLPGQKTNNGVTADVSFQVGGTGASVTTSSRVDENSSLTFTVTIGGSAPLAAANRIFTVDIGGTAVSLTSTGTPVNCGLNSDGSDGKIKITAGNDTTAIATSGTFTFTVAKVTGDITVGVAAGNS